MLARTWRNRNPFALLEGLQTGSAATLENSRSFFKELKVELPYDQQLHTRYLSKGYKNADSKGRMHPNVSSSTLNNSKLWKKTQCPSTDEWMKKMWFMYTMEYYLVIKTKQNKTMKSCYLQQCGWNWRVLF